MASPTNPTPAPPTSIKSWLQWCIDADPNYNYDTLRFWIYEYSNGRQFLNNPNVYTTPGP